MKRFLVAMLVVGGASAAYGEIYTWKDAGGAVHYTNSLHEIPARYLKRARVLDVATGKTGGLATAQPAMHGTPAATPGQAAIQQPPAMNALATPVPAAPPASSAPPAAVTAPPATDVIAPQPPTRLTPEQRRASRRRDRSRGEEEQ